MGELAHYPFCQILFKHIARYPEIPNLMKFLYLSLFTFLIISVQAQKFTINGTIKDQSSGESLIGASAYNLSSKQGTAANKYGFYSLTLAKDSVRLNFSYIGYETKQIKFLLLKDTVINIGLVNGTQLQEVVVTGKAEDRIQESSRMGTIDVPIEQIKALPAFLGEVDVMKVLQLLPGVQSGQEGSSGLYVRGGGPDQNLILLDGVPVYNASHLFGFFSVFNADAINRVELVKGGFPARYGGRLSSVIDISMKEGNSQKLKGEGSIGLVASRFTIEAPIKKDKTSFIISGRRTYIDLLARPLIKKATKGDEIAGYFFYDLNAKVNHRINEKNRIYLSTYAGDDKAYLRSKYGGGGSTYQDEFGLRWGNITTALRWNSIINSKLFSNVTATYSRYRFSVFANSEETRTATDGSGTERTFDHIEYVSGIRDYAIKADLDYIPTPNHYIKFGALATSHLFTPGVLNYRSDQEQDTTLGAQRTRAQEFSAYMEDDFLLTEKLKINAGLHASGFLVENKFYASLQPRLAARYLITPQFSGKASYAEMTQFIHLLTNAGIGLPTDLWVPATARVGPERSSIASLGGAYNLDNTYEFSIEGYYKKMKGLIEYKDGASYLNIDSDWQTKVETGEGESYGAEFFAQKKTGKLSGWVGYTLSWTNRKFPNLNEGRTFPYKYDRRHDIEIATTYQLKKNKELSLTWVYGTGTAVTLPQSTYMSDDNPNSPIRYSNGPIQYHGERNSFRMRDYHRLDLSYTTTKKTKWGERSWSFGVYNAYSQRNPFFMDIIRDDDGNKKFVQYSLFPIIPSFSYHFKF
jgi:TonB-dependent Receptor Plug Domain/CarboxypepD_reg-like domain